MSEAMPGHTKRVASILLVALVPGWAMPCTAMKTRRRSLFKDKRETTELLYHIFTDFSTPAIGRFSAWRCRIHRPPQIVEKTSIDLFQWQ
jgi:hypothetical protein